MAIKQYINFLIIIPLLLICSQSATGCLSLASYNPLMGCTACDNSTNLVLNISSGLFICSNVINCTMVDSSGNCFQCLPGYIPNLNTTSINITASCEIQQVGCKIMNNSVCIECISNAYIFINTTKTCQLAIIDYCWKINSNLCTQCSDENIRSTSNCSISKSICDTFDYQKWTCKICPSLTILHESGIFCYPNTIAYQYCLVMTPNGCIQCIFGFYVNKNTNQCQQDTTFQLEFQLLPISYYFSSNPQNIGVCLDINSYWDSTLKKCTVTNSTLPPYCTNINSSNLTKCTQCVPSFYLSSDVCKTCSSTYPNCLLCDANNCLQCMPTYYLALQSTTYSITQVINGANSTVTKCLPCSIFSCKYCRSDFDSMGIFKVRCDKCLFGYKLYNHTCISCSLGYYFSPTQRVCIPCGIQNAMYCNKDSNIAEQCMQKLYFNGTACLNISDAIANQALNYQNSYEILNKSMPLSSTSIINDIKLLMTNCAGKSNGFACLCSPITNIVFTSLCYPLNSSLANIPLDIASFKLTTSTYDTAYLQQNAALLLLLSELPTYNWEYKPQSSDLISQDLFSNYLQIYTNYMRNHPLQMNISARSIAQLVFNQLYKTFDPYQPTIISGPGYYFKYTPSNPKKNDSSVITINNITISSIIFIYFNSTIDSNFKKITGTTFIFMNQAAPIQVDLTIKKIDFLGSNEYYFLYTNGNRVDLQITDNDGYITIPNLTTSTNSIVISYLVSSNKLSIPADIFKSERIENLIYRVAFIYILIFLTLYLTLIPFCALFDCVDNKSLKRKIKTSEEGTYQGIKPRSQSEMEEDVALKINYKDFFPIYNIANTERPKRLLKLCLFLVNSQHSITFLSLIYFNLPGGQPLIAVLLAIPAYLCTVIMGYICGILTLKIPGKWKYLINLFTLGYWILWVPIMSMFIAPEYSPYVFTFAIIFFLLDMLIDFLETLLMYFTIKQESRQIKLFKALSRWLSYRGYYEFDKMAKEIDEVRDNS